MFLSVGTSKNDVSFSHAPGLKTWISHHPLVQIVSDVVPSALLTLVFAFGFLSPEAQDDRNSARSTSARSAIIMIVAMG